MIEKLKPCPFCGGSNIESRVCDYGTKLGGKPYIVGCRDCNISTSMLPQVAKLKGYKSAKEAAEATWNTRADDGNPPLTLDELRQMCKPERNKIYDPVWIQTIPDKQISCRICNALILADMRYKIPKEWINAHKINLLLSDYGKTWLAYKRKPEEQE